MDFNVLLIEQMEQERREEEEEKKTIHEITSKSPSETQFIKSHQVKASLKHASFYVAGEMSGMKLNEPEMQKKKNPGRR